MKTEYMFLKKNDQPIQIEYVADEHLSERDFTPSFWFWNRRYYLADFIRCHNNPWIGSGLGDDFPEHIHGFEADNYWSPLYIEIVGGEYVNVYEEIPC